MVDIIIKSIVFSKRGRDVFHLALEYSFEGKCFKILSNLPEPLYKRLIIPPIEIKDQEPFCDMNQVQIILNGFARQLLKNPLTKQYFYPSYFLKDGKLRPNAMFNQSWTINYFLNNKTITYITCDSHPEIARYLHLLIVIEKNFGNPNITVKKIQRRTFEKNLTCFKFELDYVNFYSKSKHFYCVTSIGNEPTYISANKRNGEVLMAFIIHSRELKE